MNSHTNIILRPFLPADASIILSWCKDKHAFRLWSANRYQDYPAQPKEMMMQYERENMHPLTATVDGEPVGHILLRYPSEDKSLIRFGFIIINDNMRGRGYGKKMLLLAIDYAKQELGVKRITLGVFNENISAIKCYRSVGFHITGEDTYTIDGEKWKGLEMEMGEDM